MTIREPLKNLLLSKLTEFTGFIEFTEFIRFIEFIKFISFAYGKTFFTNYSINSINFINLINPINSINHQIMSRYTFASILIFFFALNLHAQSYTLSGKITDNDLLESLIGVNILIGDKGVVTDFNGDYSIELPNGTYEVRYSYIGFEDIVETVTINGASVHKDIIMGESSEILNEVVVTADIAIDRETPVAFSNIPALKIQEELAAQDIPMILNSTPGTYATQSGGGDGDARITIRGFNQRNVAVMLDGIPVNDMENGWVYWSNWFGLDMVTKTMQVQRGLGASKLSIPSVGGTINILTKGIEARRGGRLQQVVGNDGYLQTKFGYTTGRMKNGWGVSAAASYKQGNGWVDGAFTKGYFYYLRIDKAFGNHLISASGFGAPQRHGQRRFGSEIQFFDKDFARDVGVPAEIAEEGYDFGLKKNLYVGELQRWTLNEEGDTTFSKVEEFNTRQNYYHKPQFSLRHFWSPNERTSISNVAYVSIGNGGGTSADGIGNNPDVSPKLQETFNGNSTPSFLSGFDKVSSGILRSSINNHFWVGMLSTVNQSLTETLKFSGGIDLRYYKGEHYRTVYDLLGGDYYKDDDDRLVRLNQSPVRLKEGDRYFYNYNGYVGWRGLFGLLEYKKNDLSTFLNLSTAATGYSLEDFMYHKHVQVDDQDLYVSYENPMTYNGTIYTVDNPNPQDVLNATAQNLNVDSTSAQNQRIDWLWKPSFTFKTGLGYNIDRSHSVFTNLGYLSRATRYSNLIITNNIYGDSLIVNSATSEKGRMGKYFVDDDTQNEIVLAIEVGYSYRSEKFSANLNGYFTNWNNKPLDSPATRPDPETDELILLNVSGIGAVHKGIELDFAYKPMDKITLEGLVSLGDWKWNSVGTITEPDGTQETFDAKGVHVGDAAQTQLGGMVRYEPLKGLYFKLRGTYFGKNYANFNPEDLTGTNGGRESWQMPNYFLTDLHTGYNFKVSGIRMGVRFNILNLLNTKYISDATNNDRNSSYADFDAKSAAVFFGQGRRFNTSFQISF